MKAISLALTILGMVGPMVSSAQIIMRMGPVQVGGANRPDSNGELAENVFLPAERTVLRRLATARDLIKQKRYGEAVHYLGAILDGPEDYFFQPDKDGPIYRSLKVEAQRLIGQMPPSGHELYQLQFGMRAERTLAEVVSTGDPAGLAEVSRRFFHTRSGYEATLLLGIDHLDHGRPLAGALTLQRLRVALRGDDRFEPTLSLALATCWIRAGMPDKAEDVLLGLKRQKGDLAIQVAGRRVPLFSNDGEALSWLAELIGPQGVAHPAKADCWAMFRGNASRNATTSGSPPLLNVRWRIPATDDAALQGILRQLRQMYEDQGISTLPGLHPLVVDDVVLMRTSRDLLAVDFVTGKRLWEVPEDDALEESLGSAGLGSLLLRSHYFAAVLGFRMWDDAAYGTMSSDGRLVFTIEDLGIGIGGISPQQMVMVIGGRARGTKGRKTHNRLAAHDIHTGKLKWHLGGPADQFALREAGAFFLGPPLPLMGRLYVLAEINGEIRLLALDAETGDLCWSQQLAVVSRNILADPVRRLAGASPSYAEGILVCPTSAGAVVAVDLATRSLLWGYRYRVLKAPRHHVNFVALRMGGRSGPLERWVDATASVVDGCVLVTPPDSDSLHCLNLIDGTPRWTYPRQDGLYVACAHQGNVVLVGRRQVRALSLSEVDTSKVKAAQTTEGKTEKEVTVTRPKLAWGGRTVELPEGSTPSGRGFYGGGHYFIPLSTAEVVAVDLRAGKVSHVSRSRKGIVPGNLICYKGKVLSQGFDSLDIFYQLDTARQQVDRRLATKADDPVALSLKGEILADEGKQAKAIACFRRAYQLSANPRTRNLLRDALLDGLRLDFATHRDRAEEIERLLDEPQQRATYLRLMATGLRQAGERRAALDHYLKLVELDQDHCQLEAVSKSHSVRRDRWIQVQLAALRREANEETLAAIDLSIEDRLQTAIDAPGADSLRQFLAYFGNHPTAGKARRELVRRLGESGRLLEAEMLLWPEQRSPDRATAGAAVAELAELLRRGEQPEDAALCYRRLGEEFSDVVCRGGKTGKELLDALPHNWPVAKVLHRDVQWPVGKVEVEKKSIKASRNSSFGRYSLPYRGSRGPFFADTTIRFDQNQRMILGRDGLGIRQWEASLVEPGVRRYRLPFTQGLTHGRVHGHLLLVSTGYKIMAVDTLDTGQDGKRKLLWSRQDLTDTSQYMAHFRRIPIQLVAQVQHFNLLSMSRNRQNALGPVTSRHVIFQRHRNLVAADPLTGDILWVRRDVPPARALCGDDEFVFVLVNDQPQAMVFRALDGELLGTRKLPPPIEPIRRPDGTQQMFPCIAPIGRQVLVWRQDGGHRVLELFDLWEQRLVRPARKFAAGAKGCLVEDEAMGVLEPDGHFVLLALSDGRTIVDTKLELDDSVTEIVVFRSGDQYVLVTHSLKPNKLGIQRLPGALCKPIVNGKVYLFDRLGNPQWPGPVTIEHQQVLLDQPGRLPVLTFACQIYDRTKQGSTRVRVRVLCIDKRTGQKVFEDVFDNPTSMFEIRGNPQANTVEVRLDRNIVTLTFTDEQSGSSEPEQRATVTCALLKVLWKAAASAQLEK